jgi:hypothetical protein
MAPDLVHRILHRVVCRLLDNVLRAPKMLMVVGVHAWEIVDY